MGRHCDQCGKKVSKSNNRSCKSEHKNKNKVKENNANNAQIINVDVIPGSEQFQVPTNANAQENHANSGQIGTSQSQIGGNAGPFSPVIANSPLGGLTAEEVKNLIKGATDFASEASGQSGFDEDASVTSNDRNDKKKGKDRKRNHRDGCDECGKKKCKCSNKSNSSYKSKQNQQAKNNKVNVNLALILTRSSQTPTVASAQSADNFNHQEPVTSPITSVTEEFIPIPSQ